MDSIRIGVVMDPINNINIKKDSTFAMMLAAQDKGWDIYYLQPQQIFVKNSQVWIEAERITVEDNPTQWFQTQEAIEENINFLDIVLMRKDPPFNMDYIYSTYLLELAEQQGVFVANKPSSIRDFNEKLSTAYFPQCCVPSLVTSSNKKLKDFATEYQDIIVKPLDGMGGASIFRIQNEDPNLNVILETLTENGSKMIMAQRFIPDIKQGDKRILLIDGEPVPYALARIPAKGETRGNLAAGGSARGQPLTDRDRWICEQVAPMLKQKGLLFVGIDVIGDYLTEINVTSPTCIRELDQQFNLDIAGDLMTALEKKLQ